MIDRLNEALIIELDALSIEDNDESNLRSSIEIVIAYLNNDMENIQASQLKDDSLLAIYWHLLGKKRRALKLFPTSELISHNYTLLTGNLLPKQTEFLDQNVSSELLFELGFASSKNVLINGKRIAKKRSFQNYDLYELKSPNGVTLTLIKELNEKKPIINVKTPLTINNSVLFHYNSNSIKYYLQ